MQPLYYIDANKTLRRHFNFDTGLIVTEKAWYVTTAARNSIRMRINSFTEIRVLQVFSSWHWSYEFFAFDFHLFFFFFFFLLVLFVFVVLLFFIYIFEKGSIERKNSLEFCYVSILYCPLATIDDVGSKWSIRKLWTPSLIFIFIFKSKILNELILNGSKLRGLFGMLSSKICFLGFFVKVIRSFQDL